MKTVIWQASTIVIELGLQQNRAIVPSTRVIDIVLPRSLSLDEKYREVIRQSTQVTHPYLDIVGYHKTNITGHWAMLVSEWGLSISDDRKEFKYLDPDMKPGERPRLRVKYNSVNNNSLTVDYQFER